MKNLQQTTNGEGGEKKTHSEKVSDSATNGIWLNVKKRTGTFDERMNIFFSGFNTIT